MMDEICESLDNTKLFINPTEEEMDENHKNLVENIKILNYVCNNFSSLNKDQIEFVYKRIYYYNRLYLSFFNVISVDSEIGNNIKNYLILFFNEEKDKNYNNILELKLIYENLFEYIENLELYEPSDKTINKSLGN